MYELSVEDHFDAAHCLPGYDGPCANLHGHTWRVRATWLILGALPASGMGFDFKLLKGVLHKACMRFDHCYLNDIVSPPTAECLASTLYEYLHTELPVKAVRLVCIELWETRDCRVIYSP